MEEHPILFSGPMVRAILEGCKTQTRRVVKPQFGQAWGWGVKHGDDVFSVHADIENPDGTWKWIRCPHGVPLELLWVRETWRFVGIDMNRHGRTHWVEDAVIEYNDEIRRTIEVDWKIGEAELLRHNRWRPSIHMPRWASRLTLRITDVRVQRVQEITEEDAKAEGVNHGNIAGIDVDIDGDVWNGAYRRAFARLWDSINAKRGYSWASNPWVWAITFSPLDAVKERI